MSYSAEELLQITRSAFREIGYRDELLIDDYPFADFFSPSYPVREIPLAGFAQHPPSYRSSSFGVLLANGSQAPIASFAALGAPHLFVIHPATSEVRRWRMLAARTELIDTIKAEDLFATIRSRREEWGPESVLRAKSIGISVRPEQLDFYDRGLLPVLEREAHEKLDKLFNRTITVAVGAHHERLRREPTDTDYRELFRLVFRLVVAKLLADRKFPGEWSHPDAQVALGHVTNFYFQATSPEKILVDKTIQQLVWDEIRTGFHLQNLSLEALAYVYENTFVSTNTRRTYDTHATPPEVAEFMVRRLPFEEIADPNERTVFEPFAGHAPFLTASLGRLRALLPLDMSTVERHEYLVRMLSGIELDPFAREVARYSLILADYPNPNGWRIEEDNVFTSPKFDQFLNQANIVLCNPPFGDFTREERVQYPNLRTANRAVEALLRVLEHPPQMLGFILPRSFTDGRIYKEVRKQLAEVYGNISIIALPDTAFRFSEAETVVVLASDRAKQTRRWQRIFISKDDYDQFWHTGRPTWEDEEQFAGAIGEEPQLWKHPLAKNLREHLSDFTLLKEVTDIHRGIEYKGPVAQHVSDVPQPGFVRGLQNINDGLEPYVIHGHKYLNMDPNVMRTGANLHSWDKTKVVANAARISRGVWRIIAAVDSSGLVCYQRFHGIWPKDDFPVDVIAAALNGPVANALLSLSGKTRDNLIRDLETIPLPHLLPEDVELLSSLLREYRLIYISYTQGMQTLLREMHTLIAQIDTIVLSGYHLPTWLESELLDYIGHTKRPRLKVSFIDQMRERHGVLVDKKFLDGLSKRETDELEQINRLLDAAEAKYYASVKDALNTARATVLERLQIK